MTKDLYFLRLIAEALKQPDSKAAIERAFKKIIELGKKPEYDQGFRQFKRFMALMTESFETYSNETEGIKSQVLKDLAFQLSAGLVEADQDEIISLVEFIRSHRQRRVKFDQMHQDFSIPDAGNLLLEVIVNRNGENIYSIPVEDGAFNTKIKDLKTGFYNVRLNTGRILWQGELTAEDLVWTAAFPEADMAMAADTDGHTDHVSKEIRLLAGDLIIRIIPELETGCIEIEIRN
jgi:hypothetical protein